MDDRDCDQEIQNIVNGNHAQSVEKDDTPEPKPEVEIETAAQLQEDLELRCQLGGGPAAGGKVFGQSDSGSSNESQKSANSPTVGSNSGGNDAAVRLKLGGFSGQSSRKGSSCSTPISSLRELDYPSSNVLRPAMLGLKDTTDSFDEGQRLTIRLHYNPVMDEWISLSDEKVEDKSDGSLLFELYKNEGSEERGETINIGRFLANLETTGIRKTDPRIKNFMDGLKDHHRDHGLPGTSVESLELDQKTFLRMIGKDTGIIAKAFKTDFVIPEFEYFTSQLARLFEKCKSNNDGKQASYIPQLAKYDSNYWGMSICTVDGQRFSMGDTTVAFTLQSCSKPFTYGICLNELGRDVVHRYVGQEPSGRMFNELTLDYNNKPHNPLLNSGAIMSSAILLNIVDPEKSMSEKFDFVVDYIKRLSGGTEFVGFNNSVFLSERDTADRNYALAYYMKENKCFPKGFDLQEVLDFYFQTCSMELNCETLAVMGSTLANGGICPTTGEKVFTPESVRDVLSLMHSCGMYNYSGQFAFHVGLPAKSGVSGAFVLVIPNVMGIGLWSPPLDILGNSCRTVQFSKEFVKLFNFHRFDNLIKQNYKKLDPRLYKFEAKKKELIQVLYAATTGDVTALKRYYYSNVNMNCANYDGRTALHLAAAEGHLDCAAFLVETCGLSPVAKDRWSFTPLFEARRFHHELVFRYLLKYMQDHFPKELEHMSQLEENYRQIES